MANRDINTIYNTMLYIVRKARGVFVTPQDACLALDNSQMELFADAFSQFQIDQKIVDCLSPFKTQIQFTSAADGQVTMPSDYQHLAGNVYTVTGSTVNPVRFVNEDELAINLTNQLRPVSTSKPIALDSALGFQLFPNVAQTGFYTYLRRPATPFLNYTQVGRVITYDPVGSTQIEFYDVYIDNIISRALKYLGINMAEPEIQQFAQMQQQETNG